MKPEKPKSFTRVTVVQGCQGPSRALEGFNIQEKKKRQIVMAVCSSIHRQEREQIKRIKTGCRYGAFASIICPGLFRGRRGQKLIFQCIYDMGFRARWVVPESTCVTLWCATENSKSKVLTGVKLEMIWGSCHRELKPNWWESSAPVNCWEWELEARHKSNQTGISQR